MLPETYFKKYNCIYGDRSRFSNGKWSHEYIRFTNLKKALEWKEEGKKDFGYKRELLSKNDCQLRGVKFDGMKFKE